MTIKKLAQYIFRGYYTDGDHVVHRKYGRYPKNVPFFQGMTIHPGQTAYLVLTEEMMIVAMKESERTGDPVEIEIDLTNQIRH